MSITTQATAIETKNTVKQVVRSLEEAKAEVARLNTLNESKGPRFFGKQPAN